MEPKFTFNLKSKEIKYLIEKDNKLAVVISSVGEITYTLYTDPYLFLIDTIIGQMLSNKVADIISTRFRVLCQNNLNPESIFKLNIQDLRNIGLSNQKAEYILSLTGHVIENSDFFDRIASLENEESIKLITKQRGLGNWTAKMYLIFVLNRLDILPYEDGAFLQVYKWVYVTEDIKPKDIMEQCTCWSPYSSIAARYMYRYLDGGNIR